jgi:hypothetical protein
MSQSFASYQEQDRRLVLLRALENAAQYSANAYLLRRYCDVSGHVVSLDRIQGDLDWLTEAGLVTLDKRPDIWVATLTTRGLDVATGRAVQHGVQRPQPGV